MKRYFANLETLFYRFLLTCVMVMIVFLLAAPGTALAEEPGCEAARPQLMVDYRLTYWASLTDYLNRSLTVDTWLRNDGATGAFSVAVIDSVPGGGAQLLSPVPVVLGDIAAGQRSNMYRLVYKVPLLVSSFQTEQPVIALDGCGNKYEYSFVVQNQANMLPDTIV